jgi:hypothetical protein
VKAVSVTAGQTRVAVKRLLPERAGQLRASSAQYVYGTPTLFETHGRRRRTYGRLSSPTRFVGQIVGFSIEEVGEFQLAASRTLTPTPSIPEHARGDPTRSVSSVSDDANAFRRTLFWFTRQDREAAWSGTAYPSADAQSADVLNTNKIPCSACRSGSRFRPG